MTWVCIQLGSREHYAIPRVLAGGRLHSMITDTWVPPGSMVARAPRRLVRKLPGRYHPDLAGERVHGFTFGRLFSDLVGRVRGLGYWDGILARNEWFQRRTVGLLRSAAYADLRAGPKGIFFAYSYAALGVLRFFKDLGWKTVLGQLDPGPVEEEIVADEVRKRDDLGTTWQPAPQCYWEAWREEVKLADCIAVNSGWSRDALAKAGVPAGKMTILPLAYEAPDAGGSPRNYPSGFSEGRPLKVLFLGQVTVRKGVGALFDAIELLRSEPVHFHFAGPGDVRIPPRVAGNPHVTCQGAVSRAEADGLYRDSDVFILPTLSDGFAITQLEAQANGLPVIASRFCGEVVEHGRNGWILDPVSGEAIAALLRQIVRDPVALGKCSGNSSVSPAFKFPALRDSLMGIEARLASA